MLFTLSYQDENGESKPAVLFTNNVEDHETLKVKFGEFQYHAARYVDCSDLEVPTDVVLYPQLSNAEPETRKKLF